MWRYSDFLAISEEFIPVFSEEVDRSHRGNWKFFIPHAQMRLLLEKLMAALERAHAGDSRSVWLTGAYGTGKTFAAFVVKHLLEDPLEAIEDYFQKHDLLTPLWPRFKALRQGKDYLLVYRSASGHITTSRRLIIEVQQAIKEQLLARGYANAFSRTLMDELVSRLTDPHGVFNWEKAFVKHRGRFLTVTTAEEVIERLRAGDVKLGEQVTAVLEEEGVTFTDSPTAVKAWIREVITANNLQGIVFIWDEFTEFFSNNVPVTPLQELAQSTADMPFYLFLITHRALNQFTRIDEDTRNKLRDRFHNCQLEMTPVTAYRLIANVIESITGKQNDWAAKLESLWEMVDAAVLQINLLGERVNKEDLKRMTPIHPFTAYLLSNIASLYSSSQRTLFQFLKTDAPGSFQWFINNFPRDGWYWLTPDYLWEYFFEDVKIETVEAISDLLGYYQSVREKLSEEELRVFRVILLLIALWRQTGGASPLLRALLSVLKRMFVGTSLYPRVAEVVEGLCSRGLVLPVPAGNDTEYIIPTTTIDQSKLDECRRRVEATFSFEKILRAGRQEGGLATDLRGLLPLQGAAKLRHPVEIVSARELRLQRDRVLKGAEKPYEVGVVLVLAQDEEHLVGSEELARELSAKHVNYCLLISQAAFGSRRWNEWLDYRAHSLYHQQLRDSTTQRFYDVKIHNVVAEWVGAVENGRIRAFFRGHQDELSGCDAVAEYLAHIVSSVFSCGPERISQVAPVYDHSYGKAGAEIGLGIARSISPPYRSVVELLKNQGVWETGSVAPGHPLAPMKAVVEDFFAKHEHVNLKELWEALQQPPYGVTPSPIGILLFAFLLRGYAQGYYYSDGTNSLPLYPDKLAELIEQVMKGFKLSERYTIRRMSPQGERFCQIAREVFRLPPERVAYPEEARKSMREAVIGLGYPLWAAVYYLQGASSASLTTSIERAVRALGDTLSYDRDELGDQEMAEVAEAVWPARQELVRLLTPERLQLGMRKFWEAHAPRLSALVSELGLGLSQVMKRLRSLLNEDVYLWREERVIDRLPDLVREFDLVDAVNRLCGARAQDLGEALTYFREHWFKGKLPLYCYREQAGLAELAELIDYLYNLIYRADESAKENRAEDIRRLSSQLVSLLLGGGPGVVGALALKYTGQRLGDDEAQQLYDRLPDLSRASEEDIRGSIVQHLSQMERQKKIGDLQQRWQALTGSQSPERWSEDRGIPIHWALPGQVHHDFFKRYGEVHRLSEREIDEMISYINRYATDLARLQDQAFVLEKFLQAAAGDYADLIRKAGLAHELHAYLWSALDGNVYSWPMRSSEVHQLVRRWITDNYRESAYTEVVRTIDAISPNRIKEIVKELAAEDPLLGARILSFVEKETE